MPDEPASYHVYRPTLGAQTRVYGGPASQSDTLSAKTLLDIAQPRVGDTMGAPCSMETSYEAKNMRVEARHDTQLVLGIVALT